MATVKELQAQAKALGLAGYSDLDKAELKSLVLSVGRASSPEDSVSTSDVIAPAAPPARGNRVACGVCHGEGVPLADGTLQCNICGRVFRRD